MKHVLIVIATLFTLFSISTSAEQMDKVDVCHFDVYSGTWVLINISGNAVEAHFTNHDDGFPETVTSSTGTYLDENCETVAGLPYCGDCLIGHSNPPYTGCEIQACEDYICGYDAFCCTINWDGICASEAQDDCQGTYCQ